jgi:hypothetical protein
MKNLLILLILFTVAFGCDDNDVNPKTIKLDYYEETFDIPDLDFEPQHKTTYEYDNEGRLSVYTFYGFDPTANALLEQRHFEFSYENNNVATIEGFHVGKTTAYIKYTYEYDANAAVTKIVENNYGAGINSEAIFSYPSANVIRVAYTFSNGGSFEYEMNLEGNNILTDKTTRGSQLCSDGEYTYDEHPNPFKTLGYLDYMLMNVSVNNKLTENVDYVGCAFPNLKPESYEYEYNSDGYPTKVVTKYVPYDGITPTSTRKFYYKLL